MIRDFLPGVEVVALHDGVLLPMWTPDEEGRHARDAALAAREFFVEPVPLLPGYIESLEWDAARERMAHAERIDREQLAADALLSIGCTAHEDWLWRCERDSARDGALGLVSVLSTCQEPAKRLCKPRVPFRVQAERAAAVQAAGAFVVGGDDARMAKLRRAVGFAARAHGARQSGHRPDEVRMVTLTLREGVDWDGQMMKRYMWRVRNWHERVGGVKCRYVWVAEIQDGKRRTDGGARGAVHYHVALWVPQGTPHMPKSDEAGWWPHGSTRTELARGAVQYLLHYLKKGNSKNFGDFPNGCRIYGVGGLDHSMRRARRWLGLPGFVKGNSSFVDDWRRAPTGTGGGWHSPQGQHFPSEFQRISCGGVYALQRIRTHQRSIDADGPFAWLSDRAYLCSKA